MEGNGTLEKLGDTKIGALASQTTGTVRHIARFYWLLCSALQLSIRVDRVAFAQMIQPSRARIFWQ
eukprot:SAG31_NODE_3925_length_3746_cov_2.099260_5_plen_66_part_00